MKMIGARMTQLGGRGNRTVSNDLGQAAVEFALAAPFLIAFILFIADIGFLGFNYVSAANSVREGARCAAVGGSDAEVMARVTEAYGGLSAEVTPSAPNRGANVGESVVVSASFSYDYITPLNMLPGLNLQSFTFTKSATMRLETTETNRTC